MGWTVAVDAWLEKLRNTPPPGRVLVLDLDETLVHTRVEADKSMTVLTRPYLNRFLESMHVMFHEIVLFTAAEQSYADTVLDIIDPEHIVFTRRFYRQHCTPAPDGVYHKDLSLLKVPLDAVVIVDNTPAAYALQPRNGVPISSFEGDAWDDDLLRAPRTAQGRAEPVDGRA